MMTAQCVSRDQLQQYLSGWAAPEQSEVIEAHLQECSACEQAAAELEGGSDAFLESVRRSQMEPQKLETPSAEIELAAALDRAKQAPELAEASEEVRQANVEWPLASGDVGSYELLRPIGHGGMGSVYLARHRQLGKQLAIKLLSTRLNRNGDYTARFQREMRAAGGLDHPAIVRATDAGEHNGTHYLAMEYIEGLDLSRIAHLLGKFSIADACEIARQVALGLSHAHAAGITHRDIKPSNIMLSTAGQVKILDFGLARLNMWDEVSAELTTVGQLIGTLDYMAPEQADRPESVDYRADLYALGATLFRLLCGRAPLAASPEMSPLAKLRLLATHQPPSLATLRPDAPESLVQLLASLLARDPDARPASAAHVAEELQTFAQGADLPALVARAQARAEKEPDESSAARSNNGLPETRTIKVTENNVAAGAAQPPRRNRRVLAWAVAPLAILAGVLITLETQKGSLVIESEAANVSVKLLRDGKSYEELKIEPGTTSTRLFAGQYEVTLDGGSDSLVVDKERIEIRRGEVAIARIRQQPAQVAMTEPKTQEVPPGTPADRESEIAQLQQRLAELQGKVAPGGEEPLYDGKPLSYWLDVVTREKSINAYGQALAALNAIASPADAEKITSMLLPVLREQTSGLTHGKEEQAAFSVLKAANPGRAYYTLIAQELASGSPQWQERIFAALQYALLRSGGDDRDTIAPLTDWLEKDAPTDLLADGADYYQLLIQLTDDSVIPPETKKHFADVLLNCKALDDAYWLAKTQAPSKTSSVGTWYPALGNRIEEVAIRALGDTESDPKLAAQALVILHVLYSSGYDRTGLQDRRSALTNALRIALNGMKSEPDKLYRSQQLDSSFAIPRGLHPSRITVLSPSLSLPAGVGRVTGVAREPIIWPGIELMLLVDQSKTASEFTEELVWLFQATNELNAELFPLVGSGSFVELIWPALRLNSTAATPAPTRSSTHWVAAAVHSQAYQLLPEETQLKLKAEAIREYDKKGDGELSFNEAKLLNQKSQNGTAASEKPATAQSSSEARSAEPLYKGQPLAHWLDTIGREKSSEGYEEALYALRAMLTTENAPQISATLRQVLREQTDRRPSPKEDDRNRNAFTILRLANPGKAFYEMLTQELETGADTWHVRLLDSLTLLPPEDAETIAPLTQWLQEKVFAKGGRAELLAESTDYFLYLIHHAEGANAEAKKHLAEVLVRCEALGDAHWLSKPIYDGYRPSSGRQSVSSGSTEPLKTWHPAIADRIEQVAIETMRNEQADRRLVAQALIILRTLHSTRYDRTGMRDSRAELVDVLRTMMKRWQTKPAELFEAQQVDASVRDYQLLMREITIFAPSFEGVQTRSLVIDTSRRTVNLSLEALALVNTLSAGKELAAELVWVFETTSDRNAKVYQSPDFSSVSLMWPELDTRDLNARLNEAAVRAPAANDAKLPDLEREDWLAALLHANAYKLLPIETQKELKAAGYRKHISPLVAEEISRHDTDDDGLLSFEEAKPLGWDLRAIDTSGDEHISAEELIEYRTQLFIEPPLPKGMDAVLEWAKRTIAKYDLNGDGSLTEDEWSRMLINSKDADLDHNGRITAEEYARYRARGRAAN